MTALMVMAAAGPLRGQQADVGLAPPYASALVVRIDNATPSNRQVGAGIVVGSNGSEVFIATARHVVRGATQVRVTFAPRPGTAPDATYDDSTTGSVLEHVDERLDLAVLSVPRSSAPGVAAALAAQDRLGDIDAVASRTPVAPVGCPSECWRISVAREQVIGVGSEEMIIEAGAASNMGRGSSGGALFNQYWEVVGMVTLHGAPRAYALPIDVVMKQLAFWKVPLTLRRPAIPRGGYRTTVTASMLVPSGSGQRAIDGDRLPSMRVSVVRQVRTPWSISATAIRLAPRDLGISAGMLGVATTWSSGRVSVQPFAEAGLGRVEGRYDGGGITVVAPDTVYVPRWVAARSDGLGFGAGVDVSVLLAPRIILGAMVGRWTFSRLPELPSLPGAFFGASLRYGVGS